MWRIFQLLLPALVPSWRFFDVIAPSPRIQFTLLKAKDEPASGWREFRPRPERVPLRQMLGRMVWNPQWNEWLFMISCAERLMQHPAEHSETEILKRIAADLHADHGGALAGRYLQFRLQLIQRQGTRLHHELVFESRIMPLSGQASDGQVA